MIISHSIISPKVNKQSLKRQQNLNLNQNTGFNAKNAGTVAFKGRLDFFTNFFSKMFSKKILEPVQELKKQAETVVKIKPVLPFDGAQRLKKLGVKEENIKSLLEAADGNKEHFYKIVRLFNEGFDAKYINEIFQSCKTYSGKISVPFYNTSLALKDLKVEDEFIPKILNTFKTSSTKFDFAEFLKFQKLKVSAYDKNKMPKQAFLTLSDSEISSYFYNNIGNITQAKTLLGEKNFIKLYNTDSKYLKKVVDKIPELNKSLKTHKNLLKLLKEKMNPMAYTTEVNYGIEETKVYSPQAQLAFQDRLGTLIKIIDFAGERKGQIDTFDEKLITKMLQKLPSE